MSDETKAAPLAGAATDPSVQTPATQTPATPAAPQGPPLELRKAIEVWQLEKGVHDWLVAFARVQNHWPIGRELTEAEFEAGIKAAFEIAFR